MEKSVHYISDQYDALVKELASLKSLFADLKSKKGPGGRPSTQE
jgi:hypothetical protein